jgi:hypothetical protein
MRVPLQLIAQDPSHIVLEPVWFSAGGDPHDGHQSSPDSPKANPKNDDLPYRIELWDAHREAVETVLAVTAHSSIGYAAYYAALKEYPDRLVTLRHKSRTIARTSEPKQ